MTAPGTPTPPQYVTGWVKVDAANTQAVAVRTNIVSGNNFKDWGVMTVDHGGHYATWDDVSGWTDLPMPTVVTAPFGGAGTLSATVQSTEVLAHFAGDGTLTATATSQRSRKKQT